MIFLAAAFLFSLAQIPNTFSDPDAFYHAKISETIADQGLIHTMPWMQFSTIKENFVDHHLGYHLIIAPFTKILDKAIALKIINIVINSTFVLLLFLFLRRQKIKPWLAILFTLFVFFTFSFYIRLSANKAIGLAMILLLLFIWILFSKRKWLLAPISAVFVWCYGGWPILIIILIAYFLSLLLFNIFRKQKIKSIFNKNLLKVFSFPLAGMVFGLIVNPYFPENLGFYWQQVIQIGFVNFGDKILVGTEWFPYEIKDFLKNAYFLSAAFIISLVLIIIQKVEISKIKIFWLILSFVFLVATIKSRRYIEYLTPTFIIFNAIVFSEYFSQIKLPKKIFVSILSILIIILGISSYIFIKTANQFNTTHHITEFKQATDWLEQNTPKNSIIFHTEWDEFPQLWFHNDHNYYLGGLDPTFTYLYDKDLYLTWENIMKGKETENLSKIIQEKFRSNYVFVEKKNHQKLIDVLNNDINFEKSFESDDSLIYRIK